MFSRRLRIKPRRLSRFSRLEGITAARVPRRLPVVLTPHEIRAMLNELDGTMWLVASLLYGTGMRLLEALRVRVKDVEFERREIVVREG